MNTSISEAPLMVRTNSRGTTYWSNVLLLTLMLMQSDICLANLNCTDIFNQQPHASSSQTYAWIESDTIAQNRIVRAENRRTNAEINADLEYPRILEMLQTINGVETIKTKILKDGREIKLIRYGYLEATSLVLFQSDIKQQILMRDLDLKLNGSQHIVDFELSPDELFAFAITEQAGSIDDFQLHLIDLTTGQSVNNWQEVQTIRDQGVRKYLIWSGKHTVIYKSNKRFFRSKLVNPDHGRKLLGSMSLLGTYPHLLKKVSKIYFVLGPNDEPRALSGLRKIKDYRFFDGKLFVIDSDYSGHLQIYDLSAGDGELRPSVTINCAGVFQSIKVAENRIFIGERWGSASRVKVYDFSGELIASIEIPEFAILNTIHSGDKPNLFNFSLSSPVIKEKDFTYDFKQMKWLEEPSQQALLTADGVEYVSEIKYASARDGEQIPIRITHRKDSSLDANTAMLLTVYGGYSRASKNFLPNFEKQRYEMFLRHGGALVGVALRGGDEFGKKWHDEAAGTKRATTFFDLIDCVRYLYANGWSSRQRMILTGASAGGYVSIASSLLAPELFGLVIPISPPTDILGKARLDSRFFPGQKKEYGNPKYERVRNAMLTYSPLEMPLPEELPEMLLLAGMTDSRVNSLHSIKFMQRLRDQYGFAASTVSAYFLKNAGHWPTSLDYQGLIGYRELAVFWSRIYRFLGWQV